MNDLQTYYGEDKEDERLLAGEGRLEHERTMRLLAQFVPPGSRVADVGGGTGRYAEWLAGLGCEVELLDPVPVHVERAQARGLPARVGDARELRGVFGLEGPGWLANDLAALLDDPSARARLLAAAERFEEDPNVLGLSPHLLAVGAVP